MPDLADFTLPGPAPNLDAARQQASLIGCLYMGSRQRAVNIMGPETPTNRIDIWFTQPGLTGVRMATIKTPGTVWVIFGGTHAALQWPRHIAGVVAARYKETDHTGHGFHLKVAKEMWEMLRPTLPEDLGGTKYRISGHSLGGATAFLIGLELAEAGVGADTEVMTFGEPRCMLQGFDGPRAAHHWRITYSRDLVCYVPPQTASTILPTSGSMGLWKWWSMRKDPWALSNPWDPRLHEDWKKWEHYGRQVEVEDGGYYRVALQDGESAFLADRLTSTFNVDQLHLIPAYGTRLFYAGKRYGMSLASEAALEEMRLAYQEQQDPAPDVQVEPSEYAQMLEANRRMSGGPLEPVTPGNVNLSQGVWLWTDGPRGPSGSSKGTFVGSSHMADLWDVTFCVNNDVFGKTQTVSLSGAAAMSDARTKASSLCTLRALLLGRDEDDPGGILAKPRGLGTPCVELIKIRDAKNPRIGQTFEAFRYEGAASMMPAAGPIPADPLWNSLSITIYGECVGPPVTRARYTLTIVGMPDDCVIGGEYNGEVVMGGGAPTLFDARLKAFLEALTAGTDMWGMSGWDPKVTDKPITGWVINAKGQAVATCTGHGYITDDWVSITRTKRRDYNKIWQVKVEDANTFTLAKSQFAVAEVPVVGGRARLWQTAKGERQVAFYRFLTPPDGWETPYGLMVAKRNRGRRILRQSFRRKVSRV